MPDFFRVNLWVNQLMNVQYGRNELLVMEDQSDPSYTHLRRRLSSSSRWCLSCALRLHSSCSDFLMSFFFSKRLMQSNINLTRTHTRERHLLTTSSLSIHFYHFWHFLYLLHFIVFESVSLFLQPFLAVLQFFHLPLSGSTEIYLKELLVKIRIIAFSVWLTS